MNFVRGFVNIFNSEILGELFALACIVIGMIILVAFLVKDVPNPDHQ